MSGLEERWTVLGCRPQGRRDRGGRIRTGGLSAPNRMLCQAELRPDAGPSLEPGLAQSVDPCADSGAEERVVHPHGQYAVRAPPRPTRQLAAVGLPEQPDRLRRDGELVAPE